MVGTEPGPGGVGGRHSERHRAAAGISFASRGSREPKSPQLHSLIMVYDQVRSSLDRPHPRCLGGAFRILGGKYLGGPAGGDTADSARQTVYQWLGNLTHLR
jgi:hypothetical protein